MVRFSKIAALLLVLLIAGQLSADGGYRSPFAVGFGARQLAMGGASAAIVDNSAAIYWNPAGLAMLDRSEVQLFHMNLFMDTRYSGVSFAYPTISTGVFGAAAGDLASGDFKRIENYNETGTFGSNQDLFLLGYGFSPINNLLSGVAVKGAYFDIDGYKDTGFGVDLGIIYHLSFIRGFSSGIRVSDIYGPRIKLHTLEQRFPTSARFGLAYRKSFSEKHDLNLAFDFEKTEIAGSDIYAGLEYGYDKMIFARAGYFSDRLTFGGGISFHDFQFDYAYIAHADLDASHQLSLSYVFGAPVSIRRAQRDEKAVQEQLQLKLDEYDRQEQNRIQEAIRTELAGADQAEKDGKLYEAVESYYRVLALDSQNEAAGEKITELFGKIRLDVTRQASSEYINQLLSQQMQLGQSYLDKGQLDKAAEQCNLALILDPDNRQAKDQLAAVERKKDAEVRRLNAGIETLIRNGDYDQALAELNKVVLLSPDDPAVKARQSDIAKKMESARLIDEAIKLFDQEKYQQAIVRVDSALALNPGSEGAAGLKNQLARYTAEETTLEDIKKNPEHWQIYIQGMEKYQAGDYNEALRLWRSLLQFYPNNPNLKRNIDQSMERSGKE
jgi:tetratricopeptide (TPR) repeat protein